MAENKDMEYTPETEKKEETAVTEPAKETIKPAPENDVVKADTAPSTDDDDEEEEDDEESKSNTVFSVLCAVLSVAIVFTAVLSYFKIDKYLKAPTEAPVAEQQTSELINNLYMQMFPKYKDTKFPAGMASDLNFLYASNNDLVGWLYIPGTNVNTPVVQTKDNSKYLRYNFYGSNTNYGTTYADYRCLKGATLSKNTVLYGHNMPAGTHFYDVHRYENIEWYKEHPTIEYRTLYGSYTFLISNVFYTTASRKFDGGYLFNYIYPNLGPKSMGGYIQQLNQRTIYTTGIDINPSDTFITLSTCTHSLDGACGTDIDGRFVVVGRLLRYGESSTVDTSKAKANPDYRRPQIWYDKKGKTNPYANYNTWVPSDK